MTTRPPVTVAPDLPDPVPALLPSAPVTVPPLRLLVAGIMGACAVPWLAAQTLSGGRVGGEYTILWWALGGVLVAGVTLAAAALPLIAAVGRVLWTWRLWALQHGTLSANASARRSALASYGHHTWKQVIPRAMPPVKVNGVPVEDTRVQRLGTVERDLAKMRADFAALADQAARAVPERARVTETTAHLPAHGPRVAAYEDGAGRTLIDRLHAGLPIGVNALCENKGTGKVIMDKPTRQAAVDLLVGAGVLVNAGGTRGIVLAPDLATVLIGQPVAAWHAAVIARLEGNEP